MSFFKDFKEFAMKGNVIDLAVAVVIGAAFGKIVSSLVNDIIMPLLGILTGGINFSDKKIVLQPAQLDAAGKVIKPANDLTYGVFIQATIDFILIALAIFIVVRAINSLKKKEAATPPPPAVPSNEEKLLTEIRDLLKNR
jgi:large conductance mechanosensitive channel